LASLQAFATLALSTGSEVARWFGIAYAAINSIGQLMFIPAFPFWGIAMFAVDLLIITASPCTAGSGSARRNPGSHEGGVPNRRRRRPRLQPSAVPASSSAAPTS
jgi:hypothetical protein